MSNKALAIPFIWMLLLSVVVGTRIVYLAEANPIPPPDPYCNISIYSPQNKTYNTEPVRLSFAVKTNYELGSYQYFYFLDGQDIQTSFKVEEIQDFGPSAEYHHAGQAVLPTLSDGWHNVTVFIGYVDADGAIRTAEVDPLFATAHFNFSAVSQQEPFPTLWLVAAIVTAATGATAFAVYFLAKKRNK
ncbi:MAG: hypothetical protein NWE94_03820 [Candidatus Bathyarchaeota archaeon]|nr:hypothetical protein [Candidatus Bathyarchaeota archaeon]